MTEPEEKGQRPLSPAQYCCSHWREPADQWIESRYPPPLPHLADFLTRTGRGIGPCSGKRAGYGSARWGVTSRPPPAVQPQQPPKVGVRL